MTFSSKLSLSLLSIVFVLAGCVQFKTASLYDGIEQDPPMVKLTDIALAVEPIIYDEDATDVWGLVSDECQEATESKSVSFSGKKALDLTWNRDAEGCDFAGIGIGWDGYAGKDLSQVMDYVAIQMQVRSKKGRMFGLPIVLTLEDYSGGMGFAYTGNKYFERSAIDEEWQKVTVPLSAFDIEIENLDPSNIKQLQLELQQSGSVYLDDIKLVFYEPAPQEPWMIEEKLPNPTALPVQIFDDAFVNNNGWGLMTDECQEIRISEEAAVEGKTCVYVKWNKGVDACIESGYGGLTAFGASWNKWRPVDVRNIRTNTAFQFKIKRVDPSTNLSNISIGFEDYDRKKTAVKLDETRHLRNRPSSDAWLHLVVPFSALPESVDFSKIKHLYFSFDGKGEVYIDDIQLIENK